MSVPNATVIENGWVLTFGEPARLIEDGAVLIRNGLVEAVGPRSEVSGLCTESDRVEVVDARGCVVTPGLVNAHMHLYSTFACGYAPAVSHNFREILENLWWKLDRALSLDDVRLSAMVPAIRCLKAGVTTIVDHHASFGAIRGSLRTVANAVRSLGLRACLAYEVSDRWGEREALAAIEENESFLGSLADDPDPDLNGLFGLHASFTLSERTLGRSVEAARRVIRERGYRGGFHVHCAEDRADVEDARARGFAGAVDRLQAAGILGARTIAAHCIHVTPAETAVLAETGTIVVTNPQSNMNNAVGVADVPAMLERGCLVGLGSDGMTANILEEVRAAIFTRRQEARDPTQMFSEAARMLSASNPYIASHLFGREIGVLKPGAVGDAVIWDYRPATPMESQNVAGHLVFGVAESRPRTVVCSGRVVVNDGEVVGVDEGAVAKEARGLAAALWKRL